jgi:hypothetical protein
MTHNFIIMWDCNGLEYVADVTADEQRVMWEKLQGRDAPRHAIANPFHLKLRAQANPQRNYEIYFMGADEDITAEDIRESFEANPQNMVDIVRERGKCFYSGRNTEKRVIV